MAGKSTYGGKFFNPDEKQITTIGTGYVANYLAGGDVERAGATLTNKRVYFSGRIFSRNDKGKISSTKQRKVVNVRDVTGVGYTQYDPIHYILIGIVVFILGITAYRMTGDTWFGEFQASEFGNLCLAGGIVVGVVYVIMFFVKRKTLLSIEYAGGNIAFDVRWFSSEEADIFIRNIHLAKDKIYSVAAIEQGFVTGNNNNDADEIPDL
jgi:hypothetical protein